MKLTDEKDSKLGKLHNAFVNYVNKPTLKESLAKSSKTIKVSESIDKKGSRISRSPMRTGRQSIVA